MALALNDFLSLFFFCCCVCFCFFFVVVVLVFWDRVLLCSPGQPWTHYVVPAGLKIEVIFLPQLPKYWDYNHLPQHPMTDIFTYTVFLKASQMIPMSSENWDRPFYYHDLITENSQKSLKGCSWPRVGIQAEGTIIRLQRQCMSGK